MSVFNEISIAIMKNPLVSIICLCYNHEQFVIEAIESALHQSHQNIEIVVVDDASSDSSQSVIRNFLKNHKKIKFFPFSENKGNCRAFNYALKKSNGDYIIDLAADDVLQKHRVREGLKAFDDHGFDYGINFTDAELIDDQGSHRGFFYKRKKKRYIPKIATGDVFNDLLDRHFICPPTLMMRREVFEKVGDYNEKLAYEDFDFLLRASRKFHFCFTDQVLVKRRILPGSMSSQQYKKGSAQMRSTYQILKKTGEILKSREEEKIWKKRVLYEARKALQVFEIELTLKYLKLL